MDKNTVEQQAKMYVYELNNYSKELGFKSDEGWFFVAAAAKEKADIEKRFFPTLSVKTLPGNILRFFNLIKSKIAQSNPEQFGDMNASHPEMEYIVAYNPKRPIR